MRDVLGRLYRTKVVLSCLVLVVSGIGFLMLGSWLQHQPYPNWPKALPWTELGSILVGAGILGVWLDHFLAREQDELDEQRLRRLLHEQAPAMRDAVLEAFAANHDDLQRVATPDTLDRIITNSLALRLHDERFASEVYADIRDQAVAANERWLDANLSVTIGNLAEGRRRDADRFFSVTVRWEYTATPTHPQRRFVCVSDRDEYAELAAERGATSAWYMKPGSGVDAGARDSFELVRFAVDGEERTVRRAVRKNGQQYAASVGESVVATGKPVSISYTYRTVTRRDGHLLFFDIEQPTRDLTVDFNYTDSEVKTVSVLDLVPSLRPTRIERSPRSVPTRSVRVELDGWIFPRSGVAFVWTLNQERQTRHASEKADMAA